MQVGDHAVIGGLTAVHQYCRIGRFAITGGCSKIVQDVPPFMIADGNPAEVRGVNQVGLERRRFFGGQDQTDQGSLPDHLSEKLNTAQAISELREKWGTSEEVRAIVEFIEATERGIIR